MRKKIITLVLAMAAASLISTTAMAADETISGFYDIGTEENVVITPYAGSTQVSATEKNIDEDDTLEQVYVDSNKLEVKYNGATQSNYYSIILVDGSGLPTKDTTIYYINQETANSSSVAFNVCPKLPAETTDMTLYMSSDVSGFELVNIPMNYAVNVAEEPEEHEHVYSGWVSDGDENHKKTCECGDVVTEEHSWDEGVVTLEPTVDAEGVKTYTCSVCKGTKTEAIDKLPAPSYTSGDANGDNKVDIKDVISIRRFITGGYGVSINEAAANVNGDTKIDIKDAITIRRFITGGYGVEL